jgi:pyruvate formate lyase activating enzyme
MGPSITRKAMYWKPEGEKIRCTICPRNCLVKSGYVSQCKTRKNANGKMILLGYSNPCALHVDPIEKKPLYHVLPGARAFSVAIAGCNMRCKNCQNYSISQASPQETENLHLPPEEVVKQAIRYKCSTIAYTYSEPIVWYEYMYDTARLARKAGIKNLMVTCGYINPTPFRELLKYMDAANMDLKSFKLEIYKKLNAGKLQPVLDAIKLARECGMWVEITNLVVPQWTDDMAMIKQMCEWIVSTLGNDVPLHFSRFSPMYKLAHLYPTPTGTLKQAKKIAKNTGLKYIYVGNVAGEDSNTYCPNCKKPVIKRRGYLILGNKVKSGKCGFCGESIAGIWE